MPERWERGLKRFKDVGVPTEDIRRRIGDGGHFDEPDHGVVPPRHRVVIVVAAFAIFLGAIAAFLVPVWRGRGGPVVATTDSPSSAPVTLDPASICDVPAYDPSVALLVGNETAAYPKGVLEASGEPGDAINGPATDALRAYLASSAARNAPADDWRPIASSAEMVTFAAPYDTGEWWVVGFALHDGGWQRVQEEIVDQEPTPAERGHGLSLQWSGDVVVTNGRWTSPLKVVNERSTTWTDDGGAYWGLAHVFDPATNQELTPGSYARAEGARAYSVDSGSSTQLPLTLTGRLDLLQAGTYSVVACVPQLGLASPVGTVTVMENAPSTGVRVLTYPSSGVSMTALASGLLTVHNGCLALGTGSSRSTYLVLPDGYQVVDRDGVGVLVDPIGEEVAAIGETASFGGGYGAIKNFEANITGGVPDACREGGAYFLSGGPTGATG